MLAADKLQLQSALKQQATALKEKEFNLHHSNLMTVGTQAAVLAGLDITMFIEFTPQPDEAWGINVGFGKLIKFVYYGVIISAFCANMLVVSHTTALSVMGAGLALRGPDGSMMTATDGLFEERKPVFRVFAMGLALTVGSVLLSVWLMLNWEAASLCFVISFLTCRQMYLNYRRVSKRFGYDESLTVDFRDIMEGPAAIQAMPSTLRYAGYAMKENAKNAYRNSSKGNGDRRSKKNNSSNGNGGSSRNSRNHDRNRSSEHDDDDHVDKIVRNGLCGSRNNDTDNDTDDYHDDHNCSEANQHDEHSDNDNSYNDGSDIEMQLRQPLNSSRKQHSGDVKRRSGATPRRGLDANAMQTV
jgi:hypothetical protein